jgi:hypothetical protein
VPRLYSSEKTGGSTNVLFPNTEGIALVIIVRIGRSQTFRLSGGEAAKPKRLDVLGPRFVKAVNRRKGTFPGVEDRKREGPVGGVQLLAPVPGLRKRKVLTSFLRDQYRIKTTTWRIRQGRAIRITGSARCDLNHRKDESL